MKKVWNILSTAIPIAIILFCFLGFLFAPNDPSVTDVMNKYQSASAQYPFGTDNMGRCEFSRILAGGWVTIGIVLAGSAIVAVLGSMVGLLLGQSSTAKNVLLDSIMNAVTAIPPVAYGGLRHPALHKQLVLRHPLLTQ